MTIDPRWSIFLSLGLAILAFLSGVGSQLTDLGLGPQTVKAILATITIFLGIGNSVNVVLTGIPSKDNRTGFIVKGPTAPDPVKP